MARKRQAISLWTTVELEAEAVRLGLERTQVRLAQVAVSSELEIRRALETLSPEARRIVQIRLEGGIAPEGEAVTGGDE